MALSEEEQRLLAQLEASLAAEDPKFAQTLGQPVKTSRQIHKTRATTAGLLFLVGLVLLVAGLRTFWFLSVIGFIAMFVATVIGLTSWQKATGAPARPTAPRSPSKEPLGSRLEERWRRRQEGQL